MKKPTCRTCKWYEGIDLMMGVCYWPETDNKLRARYMRSGIKACGKYEKHERRNP